MAYDVNNIFAKILSGDIPCNPIFQDEWALAFPDISPQCPVHILVIPKNAYISMADFSAKGSAEEVAGFFRAVGKVAKNAGLDETGYRIIANHGEDAHQEVAHFHVHVLGGKDMHRGILPRPS